MPFKSEKQRRFLWAKHPDIAKRWAHKYPKSNKDLPMYAHDDAEKKAALDALTRVLPGSSSAPKEINGNQSILKTVGEFGKVATDGLVYVKLPKKHGPSYAGEEQAAGTNDSAPMQCAEKAENTALDEKNPVAQKLAVVLGPKLREVMEQQMASEQGRQPLPVPANLGLKRYAVNPATQQMPPGFGMPMQQPGQPQPGATAQAQTQPAAPPVKTASSGQIPTLAPIKPITPPPGQQRTMGGQADGKKSPTADAIQMYGPMRMIGGRLAPPHLATINGNAAFGQKNSPDSMKFAGLFDFLKRKPVDDWAPPIAPKYDGENDDSDWDAHEKQQAQFEKSLRQYLKTKGYSKIQPHHYEPGGTPWSMLGQDKKYHEIWMPEDGEQVRRPELLEAMYDSGDPNDAYRKGPGLMLVNKQSAAYAFGQKTAGNPTWGQFGHELGQSFNPWNNRPKSTGVGGYIDKWYNPWTQNRDPLTPGEGTLRNIGQGSMAIGAATGTLAGGAAGTIAAGDMALLPWVGGSTLMANSGTNMLMNHTNARQLQNQTKPRPAPAPVSPQPPKLMPKAAAADACSCNCGDTVSTCKCGPDCKCRKPGGSCYKGEKQSADSGAWTRSEGKNPEGGLNAKGRASLKAQGHDIKAPVTESNPSGERAKRQNSFCSRMCGMKRVNTGANTASDPDSRINKSLRKWNCKCGSAYEFGQRIKEAVGVLGHLNNFAQGLGTSWNNASRVFKGGMGAAAGGIGALGAGAAGLGMQAINAPVHAYNAVGQGVNALTGQQTMGKSNTPFSNVAIDTAYGTANHYANMGKAYGQDLAQGLGLGEHGLAGTTMNTPSRGDQYVKQVQQLPGVTNDARDLSNFGLGAADFAAKAAPGVMLGAGLNMAGNVSSGAPILRGVTSFAPKVAPPAAPANLFHGATQLAGKLNSSSSQIGSTAGAVLNGARNVQTDNAMPSAPPAPMPQLAKAGAAGLIDIILNCV